MKNSYSQIGQDVFALLMSGKKKGGFYVDVGCREPFVFNSTWLLEEQFEWKGVSVDLVDYKDSWESRKSNFIQMDATTGDFKKVFADNNVPKVIDYLTHDLEGATTRYDGLINMPFDEYEYKIITIEHDEYRARNNRGPQREFLKSKGYELVCSNVLAGPCRGVKPAMTYEIKDNLGYWVTQEDWWVNPKYVSEEIYSPFLCDSEKWVNIFDKVKRGLGDRQL